MSGETKTVLFFPLNSPGHVNPSVGLADKLKELHGYRTVFLLLGPAAGNSIIDHGHELVELEEANVFEDYEICQDDPDDLDESQLVALGRKKRKFPGYSKWPQIVQRTKKYLKLPPLESFMECFELFENIMAQEVFDNHDNYAAAIESINPDLVVIDAYYVPPCIVNMKHKPWIRLFSANPLQIIKPKDGVVAPPPNMGFKLMDKAAREKLRKEEHEVWQAMVNEWQTTLNSVIEVASKLSTKHTEFFKLHGCPPLPPGKQAHDSPHLNVYMYPKEIDYDQDDDIFDYPARWFRCDSLVRKPLSNFKQSRFDSWTQKVNNAMIGKKGLVYFSLGSIASGYVSLVKRFLDIFSKDQERLYVVSKGPCGDQIELNPDNMIGGNYIPQTLFLERANLAIVHGGNNTVTECLMFGVPMIVMPVFADQFDNAQRMEDMGLGRRLDVINCTEADLLSAIESVSTDERMIEKAKKIGSNMIARDGVTNITTMIEKLVNEDCLDQEFIDQCRV